MCAARTATDPQEFARRVLDDIEAATAEAFAALDEWDYDRLRSAFADIAAHVAGWEQGPNRTDGRSASSTRLR